MSRAAARRAGRLGPLREGRRPSGVDLAVEPGRVTGPIGPTGAGRTTVFDVVCGLRQPTGVGVVLDRHDITRIRPFERERLGTCSISAGLIGRGPVIVGGLLPSTAVWVSVVPADRRRAGRR